MRAASAPPSPAPASPSRRGVIFSPSVKADHESAMAELRALSSTPSTPGGVSASRELAELEDDMQPSRSSSSSPRPSIPQLGTVTANVAGLTPPSLRRSGRHAIGADGTTATNEDSLVKAMRRVAARNLNFEGTSSRQSFFSFDNSKVSSNITSLGVSLGRSEK